MFRRLDNEELLAEDPNKAIASYFYTSLSAALNTVFSLLVVSLNSHTCNFYVPLRYSIIIRSHAVLGLAAT